MSLADGVERFYWPRMLLQARPEDLPDAGGIQVNHPESRSYTVGEG